AGVPAPQGHRPRFVAVPARRAWRGAYLLRAQGRHRSYRVSGKGVPSQMAEQVMQESETREFQAEAKQLLRLMVHSIYSDKDVFLRELLSNASDALDKLRLESLVDKDLDVDTTDLHIQLERDPAARTLTVRDNGIGMSREDVVGLIGTIARSGTAELLEKLKSAKEAQEAKQTQGSELIGQFGVGFYSAFMVADKVTVVTRKAGESTGARWESEGEATHTAAEVGRAS